MRFGLKPMRIGVAVLAAAFAASCATAPAPETTLCEGVMLAARTQLRDTESSVRYFTADDPEMDHGVACSHDGPRMRTLCNSIIGHTSREFMNVFAYSVLECVERHGHVDSLQTGSEPGTRDHLHNLESMTGHVGDVEIRVNEIERGFQLTFKR